MINLRKTEGLVYIYILQDPQSNKIRYVGKTNNPKLRLHEHLYKLNGNYHKVNWIKKLRKNKLKPILTIIGEYDTSIINIMEIFWINFYKTTYNNLTNHTIGGDGFQVGHIVSQETRDKISKKHTGKTLSDVTKLRISKNSKMRDKTYGKHHNAKAIKQIDKTTNNILNIWDSAKRVEDELNIYRSSICKCLKNQQKTAGGFIWEYV